MSNDCSKYLNQSDAIYFETIINEWCHGDNRCREIKEYILKDALIKGKVKYMKVDGYEPSEDDNINYLINNEKILIDVKPFYEWQKAIEADDTPELNTREKHTLYYIIACLIEYIHMHDTSNVNGSSLRLEDINNIDYIYTFLENTELKGLSRKNLKIHLTKAIKKYLEELEKPI